MNNDNKNPFNDLINSGATETVDPTDAANNKVMAILSYIWILVLIPLLTGAHKTSPFAKFHANQGLVLLICNIVASIVVGIVVAIIPFLGFLSGIIEFVFLIFVILGIINAAKGEAKTLPIIGTLFKILN